MEYEVIVNVVDNGDGTYTFTLVDKAGNTLEAVSNATNKNKVIIDRTHT